MKFENIFSKLFPEFLLFLLAIVFLFFGLEEAPIARWDELTNIQVVRDSLDVGNLFDLQYWGHPFFEKPPLWYFLTGGLVKIFGDSLSTFRLVSALSGLAFFAGIYYLSRKNFGRLAGILSVLTMLASGQLFLSDKYIISTHNFRSADLDALQLALMLWALIFFGLSLGKINKLTNQRKYFYLGVILSGLAVLTKGPLGLLPWFVYFVYCLVNRRRLKIDLRVWLISLLVLLVIILPWYLYMFTVYGLQFTEEHFVYHMFGRAGDALEDHGNGQFFYIKVLAQSRFFFSHGILALVIFHMLKVKKWWREWKYFSLIFGFTVTLIMISLMGTRLAWYILPIHLFSFSALGWYLRNLFKNEGRVGLIEKLIIVNSVLYSLITNWLHVGWFLLVAAVVTGILIALRKFNLGYIIKSSIFLLIIVNIGRVCLGLLW